MKQKVFVLPRSRRVKNTEATPVIASCSNSSAVTTRTKHAISKPAVRKNRVSSTERSTKSRVTIDSELKWRKHPGAWAFLKDSNEVGYYLNSQSSADGRKGFLIGSDSVCDLTISDDRIQAIHCLLYAENFTDISNQSSVRVYLRNVSDATCLTTVTVNRKALERTAKEPIWLQDSDQIKFTSSTGSTFFKYRVALNPRIIVSTFHDDYNLGTIIGRGNCSDVHIAVLKNPQPNQPTTYVVKIIDKERIKRLQDLVASFEQEVGVLMLLKKHPGIVEVLKVYDSEKRCYILTEYINEGDLHSFIVGCRRVDEDSAKTIFRQLFSTIKFLHDAGVVHRDIKPENIMLVSKQHLQVKLCDFEFASLRNDLLVTQCGTPDYLAPEIILSAVSLYGKECDLWSLGVVLYLCLSGTFPFEGDSTDPFKKRAEIMAGNYDFQDPIWKCISPEAKLLILGLLTVDPSKRLTADQALNHAWLA